MAGLPCSPPPSPPSIGPTAPAAAAPQCSTSYGATDATKSNKLFLCLPTAADATFPFASIRPMG